MRLSDLLGPDLCALVERLYYKGDDPMTTKPSLIVITPLRIVKGPSEIEAGERRRAGMKL